MQLGFYIALRMKERCERIRSDNSA